MPAARTMTELRKNLTIVHRHVTRGVEVLIAQARTPSGRRSQYLCVVLHDEDTGRFIVLKLSTLRRILQWGQLSKRVMAPRRLTVLEKLKMDMLDWINRR